MATHGKDPKVYLWKKATWKSQWYSIHSCEKESLEDIGIPTCAKIVGQGKLDGRDHLGSNANNCNNKNYLARGNNENVINNFELIPVEGKAGYYNVIAKRAGCKRNYLSAASCFC